MTLDLSQWRDDVAVADGGWSTQLRMRGTPATELPELLNLQQPHFVAALVIMYVEAGARFITTNTFAANRLMLAQRGVDVDVEQLNRAGAALVKSAVGAAEVAVVGSIGPSGKILAVREAGTDMLAETFAEQARALAEGGADALLLETFSELEEILLAVEAVRGACELPVIASMSFDSGPQRTRTMMGAKAEDCAAALEAAGVDAVGYNCGSGIAHALPAIVALRAATKLPLWVKPNAGLPELEAGRAVYKQSPEEFGTYVPALIDAGANIIGGCCGIGPEHIRRVAALVESYRRNKRRKS